MARLSLTTALNHEALYPRLETLTRQVESIAARKPDVSVPAETRAAAEALLFEVIRFRPRRPLRSQQKGGNAVATAALEPSPDNVAALATVLGQALAALGAFEARHTVWSPRHNGFVWLLQHDRVQPVQRLRPKSSAPLESGVDKNDARLRQKIVARFKEHYEEGFAAGIKAGTAPPD
jgi:hypothetical protein